MPLKILGAWKIFLSYSAFKKTWGFFWTFMKYNGVPSRWNIVPQKCCDLELLPQKRYIIDHVLSIMVSRYFFLAQNFKSWAVWRNENHCVSAEPRTSQQGATYDDRYVLTKSCNHIYSRFWGFITFSTPCS